LTRLQKEFIAKQLNQRADIFPESLRKIAAQQMSEGEHSVQFRALESLGLFSDATPLTKRGTPMDCLVALLERSLALVILRRVPTETPSLQVRSERARPGRPPPHDRHPPSVGRAPSTRHRHGGVWRPERTLGHGQHGRLHGRHRHTNGAEWRDPEEGCAAHSWRNYDMSAGMQRPLTKDIYGTMLLRLAKLGIKHTERVREFDPVTKELREISPL